MNEAGWLSRRPRYPKRPPGLEFLAAGENRYEPDDPAGIRPEVALTFDGDRLVVTSPIGGATSAQRKS